MKQPHDFKSVETAFKIKEAIEKEDTGNRSEFAEYLGITPRWLTQHIRNLEDIMRVKINYSRKRETYYFDVKDREKLPPPIYRITIN